MTRKYTHRGWFGFCPIYLGGINTDCPNVMARRRWLEPLLHFCIGIQEAAIGVCTLVNPQWEPVWKIRITGKLT